MLIIRLLTIILLIIAIILVCVLLWKANRNQIDNFSVHSNLILDLNSIISCSNKKINISDLTKKEIIYNPRYSSDKVVFIMDGTLTPYQQLTHFSYKKKSIEFVHNKTFLCNTELNKINLLESPIRMIGSGIFHTNLNLNDNSEFYISNQSKSPDNTIVIVLYDEVITQIVDAAAAAAKSENKSSTHWETLYDIVNTYNNKDSKLIETNDDGSYKINEEVLYKLLTDSKIIGSEKTEKEVFKNFIYMCLGINNTTFKMFKTEKTAWTTGEIKTTFRVVYYKDVLYTTDLARWRCQYLTEDNADDIVKASCILYEDDSNKNEDGSKKKLYKSVVDIFMLYIMIQMRADNEVSDDFFETSLYFKLNYEDAIRNLINDKTKVQKLVTGFLSNIAKGSTLEKYYSSILKSTDILFKHSCSQKCNIQRGSDGSRLSCPDFKPKPVFNCETFTNYTREDFQSNNNSNSTTSANKCNRTCLLAKGKESTLSMEVCKDYEMRSDLYYSDILLYEHERFDRLTTIIRALTSNFDNYIANEMLYAQKFLDNKIQLSKSVCDKLIGLSEVDGCVACKF
tara:strand:- start:2601 stop:4301 length:1701 start_codon:yes stop_codon:yes gene_type:complete